jgi:predicted component of type VI protein secretion system
MQLRSGATTGGTAPVRSPPEAPLATLDEDIPEQIEIASPPRQEDQVNVAVTGVPVPRTPSQAP